MSASQVQIKKLTTLIQQSPFQILSNDEVVHGTHLTHGEFEARVMAFVKDAESGIPGDEASILLVKALLAKRYRTHLTEKVAAAYMKPLGITHEIVERAYGKRRQKLLDKAIKTGKVTKGMPAK